MIYDIPGYEGYRISDEGKVFGLDGNQLKTWVLYNGYEQVHIRKDSKRKAFTIHRLLMMTVYGESKLQVNHKNGIKTDNRLVNLEYVTPSENIQHAYDFLGREGPTYWKGKTGALHCQSKKLVGTKKGTNDTIEFASIREAAKFVGGFATNIGKACRENKRSAYGYYWKFV